MTTDEYNSYIKNYLENDKTQSAIMLTAPWGTGKSYYIRNDLSRFLEENKLSYAVVSAYGLSSIADINKELFLEIKFQKTKRQCKWLATFGKTIATGAVGIGKTLLKNIAHIDIDFDLSEPNYKKLYDLVNLKDKLIIFEDIERSSVDIIEFLGYVNSLVEQDGVKVLLVANEQEFLKTTDSDSQLSNQRDKNKEPSYTPRSIEYLRKKEKTISDMAIFNRWCALIYVFGLLSIVIIFTNLISVFLSENKLLNKMISFDLILGIGLSVYLIYILPNEQLKTIVTAVVAALYGGILTLVGVAWTIRHSDKERREEEKKKAKPIFTFNMVLEEIKDIRTKKVCFDVADNGIEYECHVVAELENSDHALFEVKRIFHDGKWNEIEGNTVVLPNKTVYFDFRFNDDVNNLFLEVKDGLDNSYYYEIKVLSLNLLPGVVRNSNTELLHTVRELKEISIDEINKRTTKR